MEQSRDRALSDEAKAGFFGFFLAFALIAIYQGAGAGAAVVTGVVAVKGFLWLLHLRSRRAASPR